MKTLFGCKRKKERKKEREKGTGDLANYVLSDITA